MARSMTVLVTGAASGIGNASARQLIAGGHEVVAADLDSQRVRASLENSERDFEVVSADVSCERDCNAAVEMTLSRFGKIDALVHWAGRHSRVPWNELDAEEFNRILTTNTTGSFL